MKHFLHAVLLSYIYIFSGFGVYAQQAMITGNISNIALQPVYGAQVTVKETTQQVVSDSAGNFTMSGMRNGKYVLLIAAKGYEPQQRIIEIKEGKKVLITANLRPDYLNLKEVVVTDKNDVNGNTIGKMDVQLRPVNSSQDLLRLVPGLFIAQHAGGGKAEQIFLRGFDVDHGTDFAIYVDGMPVNMPSHAHGQGYADLHFLIPETVRELEVNKGPYTTRYGDLATSGSGEFKTLNALSKNQVKLEYGLFNTQRVLGMFNVLDKKHLFSNKKENLYVAGEYRFTDSYFNNKQGFTRVNLFSKYTGLLNNGSQLSITLSTFQSNWDASGQVPYRKVEDGTISRFGSIDPTEGGETGRSNFNVMYTKPLSKGGSFKNQFYYSRYDFKLYSNFTFFLNDSINGDQIKQEDHRNIYGYSSTLNLNHTIGAKKLSSTFGTGVRYDNSNIGLSHTVKRNFLNEIVSGTLNQVNAWLYADENLDITSRLRLNIGARADFYNFDFKNQTYDTASGNVTKALVSPKLNLFYTLNPSVQLFAKSGFGFHSNDARAVVVGQLNNTLPRAFGYEIGSTFKLGKRIIVNTALWGLDLESELIYVGDEGIVEAAGRSRRLGIDLGARYQLSQYLFVDVDINMNNGKLLDEPADANRIPLAPTFTSIGGISYKRPTGFSGSLRYRYMGDRAAIEDNSIIARGYFLVDAVVNYTKGNYQFGLTAENLLNRQWKEAQFATESRLQNEAQSVNEIHFTPGTPLFIKGSVSYFF
jgi:outer membrane receptor protein involved in Fe transport